MKFSELAKGESVDGARPDPSPPLKIDLVCQDICWFEQQDSEPLVLAFEVVSRVLE